MTWNPGEPIRLQSMKKSTVKKGKLKMGLTEYGRKMSRAQQGM